MALWLHSRVVSTTGTTMMGIDYDDRTVTKSPRYMGKQLSDDLMISTALDENQQCVLETAQHFLCSMHVRAIGIRACAYFVLDAN